MVCPGEHAPDPTKREREGFFQLPHFKTRSAVSADVLHILLSTKNVMMKLLSIFAFQNLKQTAGFVASKI